MITQETTRRRPVTFYVAAQDPTGMNLPVTGEVGNLTDARDWAARTFAEHPRAATVEVTCNGLMPWQDGGVTVTRIERVA